MAAVETLIVPTWYAEKIEANNRLIRQMKLEKDPAYRAEQERLKHDTKPVYYMDTSDRHRPVMIVGGRGMWYEDMKDKAKRLKEKPDPKGDPQLPKRDPRADLSAAIDRRLRRQRGIKVIHIRNNPLAKE